MDGSDSGLSSKSEDEPTTPNGPPALSSQGGYVSPVENNVSCLFVYLFVVVCLFVCLFVSLCLFLCSQIEDFSPATKRRGGDTGVTYQHPAGYNQINSESEDGDNQAAAVEDKLEECNPEELLKKVIGM